MKKIIFAIAFVATTLVNAQTNTFNQFFNELDHQKGITTIAINKSMFNLLDALELEQEEKQLISKVDAVKMIVLDSSADKSIEKKFSTLLKNMKLEELMVVKDNGDKVSFYTEDSNAKSFKNLLLDISTPEEKMFLFVEGTIQLEDIKKTVTIVKN